MATSCLEVYTVADLQQIFKCSRAVAYRMTKATSFPSFRIGNRRYVRRADLERWIDRQLGKYAV